MSPRTIDPTRAAQRASARPWAWLALAAACVPAALGACAEPGESPFAWNPYEPGSTCDVAREVFGPYCVSCHDGVQEPLDLRGPALAGLVGQVGAEFGQTLVVAGDPDASFLYKKCIAPGVGEGDLMPATGAIPAAALATLRAWIEDGAPACTGTGNDIQVGGPVAFGGPPSGFTTTHPSWAAHGTCGSGQWWQYEGGFATPSMHPGNDCNGCHAMDEGPNFAYAGTVYPQLTDPDDCRGVPGVVVEILDGADQVVARATTNIAGNFSIDGGWLSSYRARLSYQGRTREMNLPVEGNGSCNTCHGPSGAEGAPGRVVAP